MNSENVFKQASYELCTLWPKGQHYLCQIALPPSWMSKHFTGIERGGYSRGAYRSATGAVDNFIRMPVLSIAYFLGSVHNICKCLNLLNIPNNVQKVTHNAHFIQRALC